MMAWHGRDAAGEDAAARRAGGAHVHPPQRVPDRQVGRQLRGAGRAGTCLLKVVVESVTPGDDPASRSDTRT